ncbi:MAG: winged helix DNA-binding domain-containing protein, partial [Pseudomonadota bacterium]|nr:winged helix DNA-binding domain-containing protein [Pseudomonadota bacterium]
MPAALRIEDLRRYAVARSLFVVTTPARAIERLGFLQADPIRAPARAQDLTLRHRVRHYRAGQLEASYPRLAIEEDFFVNYGFMPRALHALMHPRVPAHVWDATTTRRAADVLAFIRERGAAHPREIVEHFAHGKVRNYWGGSSNASTHLLEGMHYRGLLRVVRRDRGVRVYAPRQTQDDSDSMTSRERLDALIDIAVAKYAPLPLRSLTTLLRRLRHGVPQWRGDLDDAIARARARLAHERVEGQDWFWPGHETPQSKAHVLKDRVYLLAPFDPVVWDRMRFELFWRWPYRFEAYTPVHKRKLGYYALPLLWRDEVIGWANAVLEGHDLIIDARYVAGRAPRDPQ